MTVQPARTGIIECSDYTRGHNPPVTVSRIGTVDHGWIAWWGRQDIAVYIVGFVTFCITVATAYYVHWQTLVFDAMPGLGGALVTVALIVGVPFLAGAIASMTGLKVSSFPAGFEAVRSLGPARPVSSHGYVVAERGVRRGGLGAACWLLPEDEGLRAVRKEST